MRRILYVVPVLLVSTLIATFGDKLSAQSPTLLTKAPNLKLGEPMPGNLFIELAKAVNPAVVNISTSAMPRQLRRDPFWDQFQEFYGGPFGGGGNPFGGGGPGRGGRPGKPQQLALGTGFIVRDDGLIVTNAHVIRGADIVNVQIEEGTGKMLEAKVLGFDERSDIALLKIQSPGKLTVASLGTSQSVEVGEWVAAFGNPFGHGHSMTKGIISSTGRSLEEINRFPLLQTDAAINPGNSGGPLVNARGQVIGVNSAIDARAQGIGFAIPIDEVKRILPDLENRGRLRKGYLGAGLADIVSYADEDAAGAGIMQIERGSPADKAGLRYGDIVTEFNGKKIKNSTELIDAVGDTAPGNTVTLKGIRQEGNRTKDISLKVTVAERPETVNVGQRRTRGPVTGGDKVPHGFGFTVSDLNDSLRDRFDIPADAAKRPVITNVENGSVAEFVGLAEGDVILEVNKTEVKTAKDVTKNIKEKSNTIKIARGNRIIIISISK